MSEHGILADVNEVGPLKMENMKVYFAGKTSMHIRDLCFLAAGYDPTQEWVKKYVIHEDIGIPERLFTAFSSTHYPHKLLNEMSGSSIDRDIFIRWLESTLDEWQKDYPSTRELVRAWRDYKFSKSKHKIPGQPEGQEAVFDLIERIKKQTGAATDTEAAKKALTDEYKSEHHILTAKKGHNKGQLMEVKTIRDTCSQVRAKIVKNSNEIS